MVEEKKPDAPEQRSGERARLIEPEPVRPQLGRIKTDEEARLAAEIEKLRG